MNLAGLQITVDENAVAARWIYPIEQFWEYIPSPETERWCRYFGFGHQIYEPGAFQIGNRLIVHPKVFAALEQATKAG